MLNIILVRCAEEAEKEKKEEKIVIIKVAMWKNKDCSGLPYAVNDFNTTEFNCVMGNQIKFLGADNLEYSNGVCEISGSESVKYNWLGYCNALPGGTIAAIIFGILFGMLAAGGVAAYLIHNQGINESQQEINEYQQETNTRADQSNLTANL